MTMKDDYLWDGTGEPDPDIQRLEQTLGRFRYQPKPLKDAFDQQLLARRTNWWPRLAAAAAIILMALVGLWVARNQPSGVTQQPIAGSPGTTDQPAPRPKRDGGNVIPPQPKESAANTRERIAKVNKGVRKAAPVAPKERLPKQIEPERFESVAGASEVAAVQPIVIPFVDHETSKHIERAQMLLRSFRNMDDRQDHSASEIAYEKRQSRGLLYQNIVLRRDAEARGNMPVEDLLGSLEPFLIDIANLPDKPSKDDVLAIKERMHKKEIVSALQIYSAPTLSQVFQQD
jgi:hypothetical protein